jgi:uncharacterized cysteine cluster protein YcgN (CxxCxxCC family)
VWQSKRLTQEEAAQLLGICDRTFRCCIDGLKDKRISAARGMAFIQAPAPLSQT